MRTQDLSIVCLLCILCEFTLQAQTTFNGRIVDAQSGKPLAFVTVWALQSQRGTTSDIDGKFSITLRQSSDSIRLSYVGYEELRTSTQISGGTLRMQQATHVLREVEILPGENPAHRIIKLAVKNRNENNPLKYERFYYKTYNKIVATFNKNIPEEKLIGDGDSADYYRFLEDHHFFMLESFTERSYLAPSHSKEVVTATRVSGFKNPSFSFLATDMQPFAFYDDLVNLLDKDFLNPISPGSWNRYLFILEDSVVRPEDTTFIIRYQPKRGSNFEGLKGVLHINSQGYAIENVIAENYHAGLNSLRIQQMYERVNGKWFPKQLNFDLNLSGTDVLFFGKSYISEVNLAPELRKRDFDNVVMEVQEDAGTKSDDFWKAVRQEELSEKEENTYLFMDSVGEAINMERIVKWSESLADGRLNLGYVDFDLNQLMRYNLYEGFRLGGGLYTSKKVSRHFSVGGYYAYGFKDQKDKYGASLTLTPFKDKTYRLRAAWQSDVFTPGQTTFFNDRLENNSEQIRNYLTTWMNRVERAEIALEFRALRYLHAQVFWQDDQITFQDNYLFKAAVSNGTELFTNQQNISIAGVKLRYAYREKRVKTMGQNLSLGTRFPVLWLNYMRGLNNLGNGNIEFNTVEAKIYTSFKTRRWGSAKVSLSAGYTDGVLPATHLFMGNGTFSKDLPLLVPNTFQTMGLFEFLNDRYVNLFYYHSIYRIYSRKAWFRPEFNLVHHMGFADMLTNQSNMHKGHSFKTYEKGFYESGLFIAHLLRMNYMDVAYIGVNAGVFHRYGPYQLPKAIDNWAFKVGFSFEL